MNRKLILLTGVILGCFVLLAAEMATAEIRTDIRQRQRSAAELDNDGFLGANRLGLVVTNFGAFGYDIGAVFGKSDGLYFPFTSLDDILSRTNTSTVIFAGGIWVGAIDSTSGSPSEGDTVVTVAEFAQEWYPGPWGSELETPDGVSNPDYRVWRLDKDSIAYYSTLPRNLGQYTDYANWPSALGAPLDSLGNPGLIGDQLLWCVFNDGNVAFHTENSGSTAPLGLEVRATYFAFDREDALGNAIFMKFQIFNMGGKDLRQMYISLWADPDLGGAGDDFVGSDTTISMGYCYNATNTDATYGARPPAVGYDFFQGPLKVRELSDTLPDGTPLPDAKMWGGQVFPGFVNRGMDSFNKYINGTDPQSFVWTYQYMNGLDASTGGTPLQDPVTGETTKYFGAGNPVEPSGWVDVNASDRRYMQTTGPISFSPGDSTEIVAAIVVGQGSNRLSSISAMKFQDRSAQETFDNGFKVLDAPADPVVTVHEIDGQISLEWTDTSEVDPGEFGFEGYTILQGETQTGPWDELVYYDLNNTITVVQEVEFNADLGVFVTVVTKAGKDAGVQHHFVTNQDKIGGGFIKNLRDYYFRVEAYSYVAFTDTVTGEPRERTLTSATVVTVTPQQAGAGNSVDFGALDTLAVTHPAGKSDGVILPLLLGPHDLNDHLYEITFEDDGAGGLFWHLDDLTTGLRILANQTNLSGDQNYDIVEHVLVVVSGPPLAGKDWSYTAASPPNISPVVLADTSTLDYAGNDRWFTGGSHGGELLFGGVFMEPNFWGATTVPPADIKVVEIRYRPMASYTDLNGDGTFTIGETYVVDDPAQTQSAFMYQTFAGSAYEGFFPVPFTAWDVTDPANPRQLNIVHRDRDADMQWQLHVEHDPLDLALIANLPNGGDLQFPYTWILDTDYDPTGTMYGDGTSGLDFFAAPGGAVYDAMWVTWLDERGSSRGMLAEESTLRLVPNIVITPADTFQYTATATSSVAGDDALSRIRTVPNPYYLFSEYDLNQSDRRLRFTNLPDVCTIRIFNIAGDQVAQVEKNDPSQSWTTWNLLNFSSVPVGSGIYIYIVESALGQKIGKMAIFQETEQLEQF